MFETIHDERKYGFDKSVFLDIPPTSEIKLGVVEMLKALGENEDETKNVKCSTHKNYYLLFLFFALFYQRTELALLLKTHRIFELFDNFIFYSRLAKV